MAKRKITIDTDGSVTDTKPGAVRPAGSSRTKTGKIKAGGGSSRTKTGNATRSMSRDNETAANPVPFIAAAAIIVLGVIGIMAYSTMHKNSLLESLRTGEGLSRERASSALVDYGGSIQPLLMDALKTGKAFETGEVWPDEGRAAAALTLLRMGDTADSFRRLVDFASGKGSDLTNPEKVRLWALDAIHKEKLHKRAGTGVFLANKDNADPAVRALVAESLALFDRNAVRDPLIAMLGDNEEAVRSAAQDSLMAVVSPLDATRFLTMLQEEDPFLQETARMILERKFSEAAVRGMEPILKEANERVASDLIGMLGKNLHIKGAKEALAGAVDHPLLPVKLAAIKLIGQKHIDEGFPRIPPLLDAIEPEVRIAAIECLGRIGTQSQMKIVATRMKDFDKRVRIAAIRSCVKNAYITTPIMDGYIACLGDAEQEVIDAAMEALQTVKSDRAGEFGTDHNNWIDWWETYRSQLMIIDAADDAIETINALMGRQTNEAYQEALALINKHDGALEKLLARPDLAKELQKEESRNRKRIKTIRETMTKKRYTASKHQSLELD